MVFLFVEGGTPPVNYRALYPTTLRYLSIREESSYGEDSSLTGYDYAFQSFSHRVIGPNAVSGKFPDAPLARTLQVSSPFVIDGRYKII